MGIVGTGSERVRCIHGDESDHQTAEIQMEIEGQPYLLNVAIICVCVWKI